jgi:hypothetical protein
MPSLQPRRHFADPVWSGPSIPSEVFRYDAALREAGANSFDVRIRLAAQAYDELAAQRIVADALDLDVRRLLKDDAVQGGKLQERPPSSRFIKHSSRMGDRVCATHVWKSALMHMRRRFLKPLGGSL